MKQTTRNRAVRWLIDGYLSTQTGKLYQAALKGRDPYTDPTLVDRAENEINEMTNVQLLDLLNEVRLAW